MRVLGLIPARGGSRGVPRKNVRALGGKPLIAYTIEAAREARRIDRVIVSTEDAEIASVARSLGAELPFDRPSELARDETPMLPVIAHAIDGMTAAGWAPDAVCLLQPTYPFRGASEIDACIEKLVSTRADCVISVHQVPHSFNPHWVYLQNPDGSLRIATGEVEPIPRRQELPPAFHRSGSVYVFRAKLVSERGSIYGERVIGHEAPLESSCNIDTLDDWAEAEALIARRRDDAGS